MLRSIIREAAAGADGGCVTITGDVYIECDDAARLVRQLQGLHLRARAGG